MDANSLEQAVDLVENSSQLCSTTVKQEQDSTMEPLQNELTGEPIIEPQQQNEMTMAPMEPQKDELTMEPHKNEPSMELLQSELAIDSQQNEPAMDESLSNFSALDSLQSCLEGRQEKLMNVLYCQWLEDSPCCDLKLHTYTGIMSVHSCVMVAFSPQIAEIMTTKQRRQKALSIDVQFDFDVVNCIIRSIYSGIFSVAGVTDFHELYEALNWFRIEELEGITKDLEKNIGPETIEDESKKKKKIRKRQTVKSDVKKKRTLQKGIIKGIKKQKKKKSPAPAKPKKLKTKSPAKKPRSHKVVKKKTRTGRDGTGMLVGHDGVKTMVLDGDAVLELDSNPSSPPARSIEELKAVLAESGSLKCDTCKGLFTDVDEYQSHVSNHPDPTFSCDQCTRVYYTQQACYRHKRQAHFKLEQMKCPSCSFAGSNSAQYIDHCLMEHGETEPFKCRVEGCDYKTSTFRNICQHTTEIHEGIRLHQCSKCQKSFPTSSALFSHRQSCYDLQKYLCDVCGQSFNHSTSMKTHRRTMHFGEKRFQCPVCSKLFSENSNFKRHMRIHNNTFPYSCPVCSQQFRYSNTLKSHMNKHGGSDNLDIIACRNDNSNITGHVATTTNYNRRPKKKPVQPVPSEPDFAKYRNDSEFGKYRNNFPDVQDNSNSNNWNETKAWHRDPLDLSLVDNVVRERPTGMPEQSFQEDRSLHGMQQPTSNQDAHHSSQMNPMNPFSALFAYPKGGQSATAAAASANAFYPFWSGLTPSSSSPSPGANSSQGSFPITSESQSHGSQGNAHNYNAWSYLNARFPWNNMNNNNNNM